MTDHNCLRHTGHTDFEHTKQGNTGFFLLVSRAAAASLWLCTGGHKLVRYLEKDKMKLEACLKMAGVEFSAHGAFAGHGHLLKAGASEKGGHAPPYHT